MPIYEYQCKACGHQLERLQKMSDPDPVDCPECDKPELNRMISAAGFRLKGGGWYETDFKSSGKRNIAGDNGGEKPAKGSDSKASSSDAGASKKSESTSKKSGDSGKAA
ncbi:MAG: hypothetical protein DHS20C11_00690 [Lysobacteraceae bacterium]|nr:MAG: hypothetical protein DHS20C11_00690 [Xanthomonadaceae bacterium]